MEKRLASMECVGILCSGGSFANIFRDFACLDAYFPSIYCNLLAAAASRRISPTKTVNSVGKKLRCAENANNGDFHQRRQRINGLLEVRCCYLMDFLDFVNMARCTK